MILQTGDIVYFRTRARLLNPLTWIAPPIRFFAKIKYNHVGVIVENWDVPFVNEAVEKGVISINSLDRIKGKVMIKRPLFEIDERKFAVKANSMLGKTGYDFSALLIHQLIFQTTGIWMGRKGNKAAKRMYCYEYVAWCYNKLFPEWWKISPINMINHKDFETVFEGKV
jgi:hypothetical protein